MQKNTDHVLNQGRRPHIAFFDYPDVFEDFYPHYGVDQKTFASVWKNTGSHAWLKIIQEEIGDVTWYSLTLKLKPQLNQVKHEYVGCQVKFLTSSWLHRKLWRYFYISNSKRSNKAYRIYATIASYLALLSWPLIKELLKNKPDVIFAQDYASGKYDMLILYAKILNIPLLTYHTGSTPDKYLGKYWKQFTIPGANYIFPSGKMELERLANTYKIPLNRLAIIRPPVDLEAYKPISREIACNLSGLTVERRYFIFVGRLDDSVKRVSAIITAFSIAAKRHTDLDLLIVGNGKDEDKLKQLALKEVPGKIHFLGWVTSDHNKALLYNTAECLVMSSKREGFPGVVGEAMACGLPVVSSDVGTISDLVIEGKTGWLFPAQNDEAMLNCLLWVANNPNKIKAMKSAIRIVAEENVSFKTTAETLKSGFSLNKQS